MAEISPEDVAYIREALTMMTDEQRLDLSWRIGVVGQRMGVPGARRIADEIARAIAPDPKPST